MERKWSSKFGKRWRRLSAAERLWFVVLRRSLAMWNAHLNASSHVTHAATSLILLFSDFFCFLTVCALCAGTQQGRRGSRPSQQPTTEEPWWAQDPAEPAYCCALSVPLHSHLLSSLFARSLCGRASSWCTTSQTRSPSKTYRTGWRASKKWAYSTQLWLSLVISIIQGSLLWTQKIMRWQKFWNVCETQTSQYFSRRRGRNVCCQMDS